MKEVEPSDEFVYQDLKTEPITPEQLDEIYAYTKSYKNIFNKQARKYRELSLHLKELGEDEMRQLILEEYTFLKRPVFIVEDRIFIGNNRKVVSELSSFMQFQKKASIQH